MGKLVPTRQDLAANLAAYGEHEASALVSSMPAEEFDRACEIGFQRALTGMLLAKASCLAAVEVLEGKPRALKRTRRIWGSVPAALLESDPKFKAIDKWLEDYSGGRPVRKTEILGRLSEAVGKGLTHFRYFKSFAHFRSPFAEGISYIGFDYAHGTVSLRFGVRHDRIERVKRRLFRSDSQPLSHYSRTISMYSVNMGPSSPHWKHPTPATWPISGSEGLQRAAGEVAVFVKEVAEPYVVLHQDPSAIRDTLLNAPGRADQTAIECQTFAVDYLLRRRDWLEEDYEQLQKRYSNYVSGHAKNLVKAYKAAVEQWNATL